MGPITRDISVHNLQKAKNVSTIKTQLGICPEDLTSYFTDICSTVFIITLCIIARKWKQNKCPSSVKLIMKVWYRCTMDYYSTVRENMRFAGHCTEPEKIILNEVPQIQKDKLCYSL